MRLLLAIVLLLLCGHPSALATPPTLDVRPALISYLVPDRWQSVVVTLTNPDSGSAILSLPQDLPDNAAAYDITAIVYLGPDIVPDAFTDRQVDALRHWVGAGGFLVVGRTETTEPKIRATNASAPGFRSPQQRVSGQKYTKSAEEQFARLVSTSLS